eukprot:CFRG5391T1
MPCHMMAHELLPPSPTLNTDTVTCNNDNIEMSNSVVIEAAVQTPLKDDALRTALQRQLEYYFSLENLTQDPYLVSQMNSEQYVAISTVANFKLVRSLTENVDLITSVLQSSEVVQLNDAGDRVRPVHSLKRTTLIIRDTPDNTTEQEIGAIFNADEKCPKPTGVRSDIGNTWFVTFETEEETREALFIVRDKKIKDTPIKARIKSENLLRSAAFPPKGMDLPLLGMDGQMRMSGNLIPVHMGMEGLNKDLSNPENGDMSYLNEMYFQQPLYYPGWIPHYYHGNAGGIIPQFHQTYQNLQNTSDHRRQGNHNQNGHYVRGGTGRRGTNRDWMQRRNHHKEGGEYARVGGAVTGENGVNSNAQINSHQPHAHASSNTPGVSHQHGAHTGHNNNKSRRAVDSMSQKVSRTNGAAGTVPIDSSKSSFGVKDGDDYRHNDASVSGGGGSGRRNKRDGQRHNTGGSGSGDRSGYDRNTRGSGSNHNQSRNRSSGSSNSTPAPKPHAFDVSSFPPLSGESANVSFKEGKDGMSTSIVPQVASGVNKLADIVKAGIPAHPSIPATQHTPSRKPDKKKSSPKTTSRTNAHMTASATSQEKSKPNASPEAKNADSTSLATASSQTPTTTTSPTPTLIKPVCASTSNTPVIGSPSSNALDSDTSASGILVKTGVKSWAQIMKTASPAAPAAPATSPTAPTKSDSISMSNNHKNEGETSKKSHNRQGDSQQNRKKGQAGSSPNQHAQNKNSSTHTKKNANDSRRENSNLGSNSGGNGNESR